MRNVPNYIPLKAVIETTLACNLRCKHCGSKAGIPRTDELNTSEMNALFEQLHELGCERITLSGGSPLCGRTGLSSLAMLPVSDFEWECSQMR